MTKRLMAFLRGTDDAIPGDYVVALVGTLGMMVVLTINML